MSEEETEDLSDIDLYLIIGRLSTENAKLIGSERDCRRETKLAFRERDDAEERATEAWIEAHVAERIREYRERAQAAEKELEKTQRVRDIYRDHLTEALDGVLDLVSGDSTELELNLLRTHLLISVDEQLDALD